MENFNEEDAKKQLEKGYGEAEKILEDKDKMEELLQKLEKKLQTIPLAGESLSAIPTLISLIKRYIQKEYTEIPPGTIIAVISALLYWVSPIDILPDAIPGVGYIDDAFVLAACLKLVGNDIEEYKKWRDENNKN